MIITTDIRRILFTSMMGTFLVFAFALTSACGAGFANQQSRSTIEVDDGISPIKRTTVTHSGSANAASIGLPMMGVAGGYGAYGYGNPVVGGGNLCMVHPDYCGTVVTVMTPQVAQHATQSGYAPQGTSPELEKRLTYLEKKSEVNRQVLIRDHNNRKVVVGYLGSALMLNVQSCAYITANPESLSIDDDAELTKTVRAEVLTKCADILSKEGQN